MALASRIKEELSLYIKNTSNPSQNSGIPNRLPEPIFLVKYSMSKSLDGVLTKKKQTSKEKLLQKNKLLIKKHVQIPITGYLTFFFFFNIQHPLKARCCLTSFDF